MPRYWLTAHWPPLVSNPNDTLHIYIQDQFKQVVETMRPGDRVLIYETASGPPARRRVEGILTVVERHVGAQAIICDARVASELHERPGYSPDEFDGKGTMNFKWQATTDDRKALSVPLAAVNGVFGWGMGHNFQGFNHGRGIREITAAEYTAIIHCSEV
jgi:hypothetical protein